MTDLAERRTAVNATRKLAIEELRRMVLAALGEHDAEVWLFGSRARGDAFQHSDIDIAILPHDELPSGFFSDLVESVEESSILTMSISSTCVVPLLPSSTRFATRV